MCKCTKLAPRYYGPFTILRHIGSSSRKFALPQGIKVHPMFHVNSLTELLGSHGNTVIEESVTLDDLSISLMS